MSQTAVDVSVSLFCLSLSLFLYKSRFSAGGAVAPRPRAAYLLHNQVTHARLLPVNASNAFTYPTLALLVSLNALETNQLDLGYGLIFGYGGIWGRIVGLRSQPYLRRQGRSIKDKLGDLLNDRGFLNGKNTLEDAWMMTMPSFLGFEGINPLTVYFCYNAEGTFWATVLEIHNTFGESHVHVLEIGQDEDPHLSKGYDHQWTFSREFHVSPFNDRSGFYTVSVKRPTHPPIITNIDEPLESHANPRPSVRVHLYTPSEADPAKKGALKLTALLRPTHSTPLTSLSLLFALARAPFALLLTAARILFVAWKLHYQKRLDVYLRPEPLPASRDWDPRAKSQSAVKAPGGVKWLDEGLLEKYAHKKVVKFLERRARETGIEVTVFSADPTISPRIFSSNQTPAERLTISYLSPRMFTILFLCPSAEYALLLGCETEAIFQVSSKKLFRAVFEERPVAAHGSRPNWPQRLRHSDVPNALKLDLPASHFLDDNSLYQNLVSGMVILVHRLLDGFEKLVFMMTRARIVEGQEPWMQWERAVAVKNGVSKDELLTRSAIGSVVRGSRSPVVALEAKLYVEDQVEEGRKLGIVLVVALTPKIDAPGLGLSPIFVPIWELRYRDSKSMLHGSSSELVELRLT